MHRRWRLRAHACRELFFRGAERVAKAIIDSGGEGISVGADVSQVANVARLFDKVDSAFGRVDVLVNNAGVFRFAAFTEITEESFHLHYNINVLGTLKERIVREVGYGLWLEGASAADLVKTMQAEAEPVARKGIA